MAIEVLIQELIEAVKANTAALGGAAPPLRQDRAVGVVVERDGQLQAILQLVADRHPVERLVRTHVGSVALGDQRPGSLRVLGRDEVSALYQAVGL